MARASGAWSCTERVTLTSLLWFQVIHAFFRVATMLATLGAAVAMVLLVQAGAAESGTALHQDGEPKQLRAEPTRTGKERLGDKSTDEQRIDNCNVPIDMRGTRPRPSVCPHVPTS
jgi:hypothetical protein